MADQLIKARTLARRSTVQRRASKQIIHVHLFSKEILEAFTFFVEKIAAKVWHATPTHNRNGKETRMGRWMTKLPSSPRLQECSLKPLHKNEHDTVSRALIVKYLIDSFDTCHHTMHTAYIILTSRTITSLQKYSLYKSRSCIAFRRMRHSMSINPRGCAVDNVFLNRSNVDRIFSFAMFTICLAFVQFVVDPFTSIGERNSLGSRSALRCCPCSCESRNEHCSNFGCFASVDAAGCRD